MEQQNLRFVEESEFLKANEIKNGKLKVTSVPGFYGVFRDSKNNVIDLRDPNKLVNIIRLAMKI